jgi:ADP-ribose pyrophosphatase
LSGTRITRWQGKYLRMVTDGSWEFVERVGGMTAVVILAMLDGEVILVEQYRNPLGRRCLELPAGLVGDEDDLGPEETALKELEEETGLIAERVERLGFFHSSPGAMAEGFDLVRAHGVRSGGVKSEEDIVVHRVKPASIGAFIDERRAAGVAIDVKLLLLLGGALIAAQGEAR